jgi:hypothetical protein
MFVVEVANCVLRFNCIKMNHYGPSMCLIYSVFNCTYSVLLFRNEWLLIIWPLRRETNHILDCHNNSWKKEMITHENCHTTRFCILYAKWFLSECISAILYLNFKRQTFEIVVAWAGRNLFKCLLLVYRLNARCCSAFKNPVSVKALAMYLKTLYLIHF